MFVYKIENIINKKIYIGITMQKRGFKDRYSAKGEGIERVYNYLKNNKNNGEYYNKYLLSAILKYGLDSFEVIEEFDKAESYEELVEKEKYWITHYKSNNPKFGYNLTEGGEDGRKSLLSKILRRISKIKIENKKMDNIKSCEECTSYGFDLWSDEYLVIFNKLKGYKFYSCKMCKKRYTQRHGGKDGFCNYCYKYKDEYKKLKKYLEF